MPELIYGKWGTHIEAVEGESSHSLMDFIHDGARLTMQQRGLEQLPGCAERVERPAQGEWGNLVLYLWPYVRVMENAPNPPVRREDMGTCSNPSTCVRELCRVHCAPCDHPTGTGTICDTCGIDVAKMASGSRGRR